VFLSKQKIVILKPYFAHSSYIINKSHFFFIIFILPFFSYFFKKKIINMPYTLLGMENPLLDIQCKPSDELLQKYKLKANDAILADASHQSLYKEIVDDYDVTYVAGGAAQNTLRGAQYFLPPKSTIYLGCVSDDKYGDKMKAAAEDDGLTTNYEITKEAPTGTCAVLITGHNR
jgi:adenosine kinase